MKRNIQDILEEIRNALPELTASQKKVGIFICEHPQVLGLLSLEDFAKRINVSPPTVTRFCNALGYKGFLEFSRSTQRVVEKEISHAGLFRHAFARSTQSAAINSVVQEVVERDARAMLALLDTYPAESIERCVAAMRNAAAIGIVGRMSAYPLAVYFEQLLAKICDKVCPLSGSEVTQAATVSRMDETSLLFCIAFPRYAKAPVALARQAKQRNAFVVALTNSEFSPLAPVSDILFTLDVNIVSYIDLMGPVMSLINILCVEFAHAQYDATEQRLSDYDALVEAEFFLKEGRHEHHRRRT